MKIKMKTLKILGYSLASVVMAAALVYYNFIDKATIVDGLVGSECIDFTAKTFDHEDENWYVDGEFTLSEQRGKVCILNFWETWCSACVHELPDFDKIQKEYGDQVEVVAFSGTTSTPEDTIKWMDREGWKSYSESDWKEFSLTVAHLPIETINSLGYGGALPRTVIVDQDGVIIFEKDGSMHYEDLVNIINPLLDLAE